MIDGHSYASLMHPIYLQTQHSLEVFHDSYNKESEAKKAQSDRIYGPLS